MEDTTANELAPCESPVCRIRYESTTEDDERYIFEVSQGAGEDFHFLRSFDLKDDKLDYQVLTQIRELLWSGHEIFFN